MLKRNRFLMVFIGVAAISLLYFPRTIAQTNPSLEFFQGRGIAQGEVFARGRNAHVTWTLDGDNFNLDMTDPPSTTTQTQSRPSARLQYRGVVSRRGNDNRNFGSFTLTTRLQSFDSSETLRGISNTTGSCQLEGFAGRIVYSNCKTTIRNRSSVRFLGLEQF